MIKDTNEIFSSYLIWFVVHDKESLVLRSRGVFKILDILGYNLTITDQITLQIVHSAEIISIQIFYIKLTTKNSRFAIQIFRFHP
jgi:hypothetical protein